MTAEEKDDIENEKEEVVPPKGFRRFIHWFGVAISLVGLIVLLVRVLGSDRFIFSEPLIWIPSFVYLVFLPFNLLIYKWKNKFLWMFATYTLFSMNLFIEQPNLLLANSNAKKTDYDLQMIMWNTMSHNRGKRTVLEGYQEYDSDFLFLLEGTYNTKPPAFLTAELSQDYTWYSTHHMVIASKHPVKEYQELEFESRLRVFEALTEIETDGDKNELWLILVDMPAPPRYDSRDCYQDLRKYLDGKEGSCLITGDFNTPRSSTLLNLTFQNHIDPYLQASPQKWLASFPDSRPLYQIDHTFLTPDLHPTSARLIEGQGSDHLRQVITFRFNQPTDDA